MQKSQTDIAGALTMWSAGNLSEADVYNVNFDPHLGLPMKSSENVAGKPNQT